VCRSLHSLGADACITLRDAAEQTSARHAFEPAFPTSRRGMSRAEGWAMLFLPFFDVGAADAAPVTSEVVRADAPSSARPRPHDPTFPGGGHLSTSLATGVPFPALGEVALGIGDRFAIGVIGGATPKVPGFGIRPRLALFDTGRVRGIVAAPSLYYPFTNDSGGNPWVLTRPSFVVEHQWSSGVRLGGGMGFVAAASTTYFSDDKKVAGYGEQGFDSGVWNTVNVTFSAPVSPTASVFAEGALVMRGIRLAGDEWVGGVPFTVALGVATNVL
jgi:hypothetical protein